MTNPDRATRFGVIGTGRITRRLVADLQSTAGVDVTAIASRTLERARWCADQYGVVNAVAGYQQLLGRDDVDAVYISLPPSMHAEWSIAAAEYGKHLLCEKPLATSFAEATAIDDACRKSQTRWLAAAAWLHHPRTAAIKDWIAAGRLGQIGHVSAAVSFYQPFQSNDHRLDATLGGGCLLDLGWYTAGLTRFAAGRMPTKVLADAVIGQGVSQRLTAMLWYGEDVTATISCGYDTATRKWFEIAGGAASLVCDDFTRPWADRPTRCWIHDASGQVEQHSFEGHQERAMIARLVDSESLEPWQQQTLDTQRILDALQESVDQRGEAIL